MLTVWTLPESVGFRNSILLADFLLDPIPEHIANREQREWATRTYEESVLDRAVQPVVLSLYAFMIDMRLLADFPHVQRLQRCASQINLDEPARIIERLNGNPVLMLPGVVALSVIPLLEPLDRVHWTAFRYPGQLQRKLKL